MSSVDQFETNVGRALKGAMVLAAGGVLLMGVIGATAPLPHQERTTAAEAAPAPSKAASKYAMEYGAEEYMNTIADIMSTDLQVAAENSYECPIKPAKDCNFNLAISKFDSIIAKRKVLHVPACLDKLDTKIGNMLGTLYAGVKFLNDGLNGGSDEKLMIGASSILVGKDYMRDVMEMVNKKEGVLRTIVIGCVVKQ
jgi:hypothetical protein